ncbi:hypothetical protein FS749_003233 [Ceratobasidium sp. UAMH 11750]|nr:hypothetical protein FS749_003233 [Ceratobasidium sp. UAMH 11750]
MASHTTIGYPLFRASAPFFVELTSKHPDLWTQDSTLCLHAVLHTPGYEIPRFAFCDTMSSLAFGTPPLIHYDTINQVRPVKVAEFPVLEWVYGCSVYIIILLARINSARAAMQMDGSTVTSIPNSSEWREIERKLQEWKPAIEHVDESVTAVVRFAIYESWRQAALIYLYMGMCGVNSADPRVESSVQQVAQLTNTSEPDAPLEQYFIFPCLIRKRVAKPALT